MNVEAVVALIVGTIIVLLMPALILSPDPIRRFKEMRSKTRRD